MFIFSPIKLVTVKRNKGHISLPLHYTPLSLHPFHVRTQTIYRPSKIMLLAHSRVTVIVFQAEAQYSHWTSEYAHYGQHIHFVVIIRSLAHHTAPYFVDDTDGHCL